MRFEFALCLAVALLASIICNGADRKERSGPWIAMAAIIHVLHDFRRFVASTMASLGVSLPAVEYFIGHRSGSFAGIVSVYQRYNWLPEMKKAVSLYEQHLLPPPGRLTRPSFDSGAWCPILHLLGALFTEANDVPCD